MNNNEVLKAINISKIFNFNEQNLTILDNINLSIKKGESVSITGSSGSGKSTLLHLLAGLDILSSGEVYIDNQLINKLDDISLCKLRNIKLGFVYQFHHLLPEFSALENILMPLLISNHKITKELKERALFILNKLNLYNKEERYPSQLSGGERQRVAIARAIIHAPQLIFADEPTGNLDNRTSHQVLDTLLELQQEFNTSIIIVTHDLSIADKTHTKYQLKHGHLN